MSKENNNTTPLSLINKKPRTPVKKIVFTIKSEYITKPLQSIDNLLPVVDDKQQEDEVLPQEDMSIMTLSDIFSKLSKPDYTSSPTEDCVILFWFKTNGLEVNINSHTIKSLNSNGSELLNQEQLWSIVCLYFFYYSKIYQRDFTLDQFVQLSNTALEHLDDSAALEYIENFYKSFIVSQYSNTVIRSYVSKEKVKGFDFSSNNYEVFLKKTNVSILTESINNSTIITNKKYKIDIGQSKSPKPRSYKTISPLNSLKKFHKEVKNIYKKKISPYQSSKENKLIKPSSPVQSNKNKNKKHSNIKKSSNN